MGIFIVSWISDLWAMRVWVRSIDRRSELDGETVQDMEVA